MSVHADSLSSHRYDVYYGDLNNDGLTDIYLHGSSMYVPIGISDISFPVMLPELQSLVLYRDVKEEEVCQRVDLGTERERTECSTQRTTLDQYTAPEALTLTEQQLAKLVLAELGTDFFEGQTNGDDYRDFLIRGLGNAPAVSLAGSAQGAMPNIIEHFTNSSLAYHEINDRSVNLTLRDTNRDGRDDLVVINGSQEADTSYLAGLNGQLDRQHYDAVVVTATQPKPATLVGSMAGQFNVNETGAATYAIPISVPEGVAGVTPSISLLFNSSQGNGLLGQSWALSASDGIARCAQKLKTDGQARPVTFSADDRFCLNGQRLIVVKGQYGGVGSHYKTELDSQTLIQSVGGRVGHPDHFKTLSNDGTVRYYGHTYNARTRGIEGKTAPIRPIDIGFKKAFEVVNSDVIAWNVSQSFDSVGNKITYYYYDNALDGHRLSQINYAYGNDDVAAARVRFHYETRPDIVTGYLAGYQFATRYRVKSISVDNNSGAGFTTLRSYNMHYQRFDPIVGNTLSRLGAIQECADRYCLPATTFDWQDLAVPSFTSISSYHKLRDVGRDSLNSNHVQGPSTQMDINGDGLLDWVVSMGYKRGDNQRIYYFLSDGKRLREAKFTNNEQRIYFRYASGTRDLRLVPIDYNSDGFQDLAIYHKNDQPWRVYLSVEENGTRRLSSSGIELHQLMEKDTAFVDVNRDGLVDVLAGDKEYIMRRASKPTATRPYELGQPRTITWSGNTQTPKQCQGKANYSESKHYEAIADVNGDGIMDAIGFQRIFCQQEVSSGLTNEAGDTLTRNQVHTTEYMYMLAKESDTEYRVLHYLGSRGKASAFGLDELSEKLSVRLRDLNGDGLQDLIRVVGNRTLRTYTYLLNTGRGFAKEKPIGVYSKFHGVQFVDINKDNLTDVVYHNYDSDNMVYSTFVNGRFSKARPILATNGKKREQHLLVDFTGDGLPDYVRYGDNKLFTLAAETTERPANTLYQITSSLGAVTTIDYSFINKTEHYQHLDLRFSERYAGLGGSEHAQRQAISFDMQQGIWDLPTTSVTGERTQILPQPYPVLPVNGGVKVVTQVSSTSPAGHPTNPSQVDHQHKTRVQYHYSGARVQGGGRGLLGFKSIRSVDAQTGIQTVTRYRQDYPFIGAPEQTLTLTANGERLKRPAMNGATCNGQGKMGRITTKPNSSPVTKTTQA